MTHLVVVTLFVLVCLIAGVALARGEWLVAALCVVIGLLASHVHRRSGGAVPDRWSAIKVSVEHGPAVLYEPEGAFRVERIAAPGRDGGAPQ